MVQEVVARANGGSAQAEPVDEPNRPRRILCATDLTGRSWSAERRASLLAQQMNAELLFVHAMPTASSRRARRLMFARAHIQLLSRADRALAHAPYEAKVSVRHGTPIQAITEAASEWQPDLIAMARPRQRTLDLVLGTTVERVIRATQRAVLVVNATTDRNYRNAVLATDMSDVSVHVARTLTSMGVDLSREVLVERTRPLEAIQKCLQIAHPELLVIGTSRWFKLKRMLFGSVADQVLRRVECDVLAISPPVRATRNRAATGTAAATSLAVTDQSLSV